MHAQDRLGYFEQEGVENEAVEQAGIDGLDVTKRHVSVAKGNKDKRPWREELQVHYMQLWLRSIRVAESELIVMNTTEFLMCNQ